MEELKKEIQKLIDKPLAAEACEIADIILSRYKSAATIKVFVYSDESITHEKCSHLSRIIGDILDGTDLFEKGYTLEVSSPGLDRPLKELRDFKYRIGETIRIRFTDNDKKAVTAEIVSTNENSVCLRNTSEEFRVEPAEIETAKIVI